MSSKAKTPPALVTRTTPGNAIASIAIDNSRNNSSGLQTQAERAVEEMAASGAVFQIVPRDDGLASFLYELKKGGDRARCRQIIAEAKRRGGAYWDAFINAVVAHGS